MVAKLSKGFNGSFDLVSILPNLIIEAQIVSFTGSADGAWEREEVFRRRATRMWASYNRGAVEQIAEPTLLPAKLFHSRHQWPGRS